MSVLEKLTEGIVHRDVSKEGAALLAKWEKTGLLEGISNEQSRNGMAVLLENQAKELLREASTLSAGDVEGFASVAFPIVRRVFGGLIANDLVSVQPMSLPSGLIFFLDFVHSTSQNTAAAGQSVYGGNVVGRELTGGVNLADNVAAASTTPAGVSGPGGFYNLGHAYSSATGSYNLSLQTTADAATITVGQATHNGGGSSMALGGAVVAISDLTEAQKKQLQFDPDVLASPATDRAFAIAVHVPALAQTQLDFDHLSAFELTEQDGSTLDAGGDNQRVVRRLTRRGLYDSNGDPLAPTAYAAGTSAKDFLTFVVQGSSGLDADLAAAIELNGPIADTFKEGGAGTGLADTIGAVVADDLFLEGAGGSATDGPLSLRSAVIPEIDIKVDSIAVTAQTKKLKAKWSPELGQDLNAYHNLDAEVELTGILSEQIALEIDREILSDLIKGATAGTRYWSRAPGLFVDSNGREIGAASAAPDFTGTVSEWYETLIETINDVSAQIHRKTLRGGANFVVCSPEVANILEFTAGFRASVTADADRGDIGAVRVGSLSKKFDVMVDPYFPRNVLLVGRRGNSFLESGYVYAPYVPLQVTPTIFGQEDFVPRKGVMTRYAKKMVRPDMYGLVICRGLLGEEGGS